MSEKPDCHKCIHHRKMMGNVHIECANRWAKVQGKEHGIKMGWFMWPYSFDPVWLVSCDSFEIKEKEQ